MPRRIRVQKGSERSKTRTPMVRLWRLRRERAEGLGWYPRALAVSRISCLVGGATCRGRGGALSTMETVEGENPLWRATSMIVTCVDRGRSMADFSEVLTWF